MACCLPNAPGRCPGPAYCPCNEPAAPEPHDCSAADVSAITYVEFDKSRLTYAEWTEKDGKDYWAGAHFDMPIPDGVREFLAKQIVEA